MNILSRLMRLTVETGFITAAFSVIQLVLFVAMRSNAIYAFFLGITCRVYSNCLMAVRTYLGHIHIIQHMLTRMLAC